MYFAMQVALVCGRQVLPLFESRDQVLSTIMSQGFRVSEV